MFDRVFSQVRSVPVRAIAGAGGIAAIAASWSLGLLEARYRPALPDIALNQDFTAGEWRLRLSQVAATSTLPDGRQSFGRTALVLTVDITNVTSRTSSSYTQAIKLVTPIAGVDPQPIAYLERDQALLTELHPGLGERVAFVWTCPRGARVPDRLRFEIAARRFKPRDNLYAASGWFDAHPIGVVELPVEHPAPPSPDEGAAT